MELKEYWQKFYQEYEVIYWQRMGIEWCADEEQFENHWNSIKSWIGELDGEVLDIGCGARPPFDAICIEPLADEYKKIAPEEWWKGKEVYVQPAEDFIDKFEAKFDYVISWNSLDHAYDWRKVLDNMKRYVKKDGTIIISTDCRFGEEKSYKVEHPQLGLSIEEFVNFIQNDFMIMKMERKNVDRDLSLILKVK